MSNEEQSKFFNAPLVRLLGLAKAWLAAGSSLLLVLNEAEDGRPAIVGEAGLAKAFAKVERGVWRAGTDRWEGDAICPILRERAEEAGVCLLGGVPVSINEEVAGGLLLAANVPRECSEREWQLLENMAEQIAIVLERDRLVAASERQQEFLADVHADLLVTGQFLEVLCKTDATGTICSINPSAEELLGFEAGELIGRNFVDLIHPAERSRAKKILCGGGEENSFETEFRWQHRLGYYIYFDCRGTVLRDGFLLAGRNISRRKRAEAEVRRLEKWFQLVWKNSRDAMRLINADGCVVEVNDAYCRLVEMPCEKLLGESFIVAYRYPNSELEIENFKTRFARREIPSHTSVAITLANGCERVLELSNSFFDSEEETFLLTTYRDITDRRRNELELQELNEALEHRASHLGALTLQLTQVEQAERRRLAQTVHDHLQQILVVAQMRMERVRRRLPAGEAADAAVEVEELLAESIETSRSITVELSPPVLHDGGLIAALEWLERRVHEKQGLNVTLVADADAEPSSEVIRLFLFQAVRELLFNSYKYSGVNAVEVRLEQTDRERVRVIVKDAGVGFDWDSIRASAAGSRDCFGLFSLRERVDHIGGNMRVVTAPGSGTCVTLVVPLEPDVAESFAQSPKVSPPQARLLASDDAGEGERGNVSGRQIRLMLVDDHKIMREGLRELLRDETDMCVVGEAQNGLEGVKLAKELQPDLVVMDITMPVMNGIEATQILCAELPATKVIGLSMHMKEDMAQAILDAGACAYVTKATASETLTETIRECLAEPRGEGDAAPPSNLAADEEDRPDLSPT